MPGSGENRLSEPGEVIGIANRSDILEDDEEGVTHAVSKVETEQSQDTDSSRASTYESVADEHVAGEFVATADGSSSFDTNDVHAGAAILTVITKICQGARKPSSQERGQLHTLFELMPYLMTREAREPQGEDLMSAFEFLIRLYDSPMALAFGGGVIGSMSPSMISVGRSVSAGAYCSAGRSDMPSSSALWPRAGRAGRWSAGGAGGSH